MLLDILENSNNTNFQMLNKFVNMKFQGLKVRYVYLMNKGLVLLMYEQDLTNSPERTYEFQPFSNQVSILYQQLQPLNIPTIFLYVNLRNQVSLIDLKEDEENIYVELTKLMKPSEDIPALFTSGNTFITNTYEIENYLEQLRDRPNVHYDRNGNKFTYVNGKMVMYSPIDTLKVYKRCKFFGMFGIHKFSMHQIGQGLLYLFTLGGFGTLWFADMLAFNTNSMKDKKGQLLYPLAKEEKSWLALLFPLLLTLIIFVVLSAF